MQESSRTFLRRAGVAAATAAFVVGSTFVAGPAPATAGQRTDPAVAVPTAVDAAAPDARSAALPQGLAEAVQRDLGMGVEEFKAQGELVGVADQLRTDLQGAGLKATFAIDGNKIAVSVGTADREAVAQKLDALTRGTGVDLALATAEANTASASMATAAPTRKSPADVDELYKAYAASVDSETLSQLQAVMETADGYVIRSGSKDNPARPASRTLTSGGKLTPEEFAVQYPDVSIHEAEGPATVTAANDVLGGMGYGAPIGQDAYTLCSLGFNGFNASGDPAALSAGHCTRDGQITNVYIAEHGSPDVFEGLGAKLGSFGFSQFGGPGNTSLTTDGKQVLGNIGTDVSVLDKINSGLRPQPLVTDWKGVDERGSGAKVTGVASAVIGASVCKSGRTTGWTCGTVDEIGIFIVGGFRNSSSDLRGIRGFGMSNPWFAKAFEGDSGGAVISGGKAVGLTSAISDESDGAKGRAYFTDINQALKQAKGYSIKIFVNAPKITTKVKGAGMAAGAKISGTVASAPSGSTVQVVSSGKKIATAKISKGAFSFKTPQKLGTFKFTVQTAKGFSKSRSTAGSVKLLIPAPRITAPTNGATSVGSVTKISGKGFPGATVKLSGAVKGKAKVGKDGKWSKKTGALGYGGHKITVTQSKGSLVSRAAVASFKVAVPAPAFTAPARNTASTKAPRAISGTGIPGATLKLSGDVIKSLTIGGKGKWSVKLKSSWSLGSYGIKATQKVGKHTSANARISFKVVPKAPSIASPTAGRKFAQDKAPTTISGRGISGATVTIVLGKAKLSTTVVRGAWKAQIPGGWKAGSHTATAVQVLKKTASAPIKVKFSVAGPDAS
ncbi:S1 family peptidase [Paeniglutamicibacter kerguelensis]|uniref:Uncharacterized protein n=1 Tax=Paeniglutamicibacter kerguelensis TaxID=254788 RepID=A0ABS4XB61_9MICC|nr:S1 family peptidase [Paeniglutamicibacter kerguelensis]MBP2385707.1 hypothetical protein [Paeniglutamicibacter kerguelensis]